MHNQTQSTELHISLEEVKEKVKLMEALDTLHRSPAFKKVIGTHYLSVRPKELVRSMAMPMNEMQKELLRNSMVGISALQAYFHTIYKDGKQAQLDIAEYEKAIQEDAAELGDFDE